TSRAIVAGERPGPLVLADAREISVELFAVEPPADARVWAHEGRPRCAPAAPTAPVLSVVITTLDRRDLFERCLAGFAAQTLPRERFEVVVVDDGSREPVADIVERYRDRLRLTYLYQENRGLAAARNAGIAAARGTIIVPYDDDNAPHPECLAEHARFHE